jgi:hypothetical protein
MHDLSGSWRRHQRAKEHVADIERLVSEFRNQGKVVLPPKSQLQAGQDAIKLPPADTPADDLAIRVGEATYNLRAALDYAVHTISGEQKSQFPLDDRVDHFNARKTGRLPNGKRFPAYLKGVPKRECNLIEAVQPCKGVDWSRRLRELTNRDKHRDLVLINATSGEPFTREEIGALYPSPNLYPSASLFPSAGHVEMYGDATFDIALDDGAQVAEALQELEAEVGALLTRLESA